MKRWSDLKPKEKQDFRDQVFAVISEYGPVSHDDIRVYFDASYHKLVTVAVRNLVGKGAVFCDETERYQADVIFEEQPIIDEASLNRRIIEIDGVPCTEPTHHGPGSPGKVLILAARYASTRGLWVEGDNPVIDAPRPGTKNDYSGFQEWDPDDEESEVL